MDSRSQRNAGIDLLRGLSIFFVIARHMSIRIPLKEGVLATFLPQWLLSGITHSGYRAVMLFFVISGFLITSNAISRWGSLRAISFREFYLRRAARILPCLLILVAVLSAFHLLGVDDYVIWRKDQTLGRAIFSALGFHLNWYEGHTGYLPGGWDVLWSLSIEEVFYIAFPLVCFAVRPSSLLVAALCVLAASLPLSYAALEGQEIWQGKAYLPGMSAIATGVLAALVAHRWPTGGKISRNVTFAFGIAGLLAMFFAQKILYAWIGDANLLVLTISAASLVLAFYWQQANCSMGRLRGTGWIQRFGRLSYEVYLTHMFVVFAVVRLFKAQGAHLPWGFVWYIPAVLLSAALGWVVAKFLSLPLERLIRRKALARLP